MPSKVVLSVGIPVYRAKDIGWLSMESLCRQVHPGVNWEIVVCEETHPQQLGESFFRSYSDRLYRAGCVRIKYVHIENWEPLLAKWYIIGQTIDHESELFFLHGADDYSHTNRLQKTYRIMQHNEHDWYHINKGYFYDVNTDRVIRYNSNKQNKTHLFMTTRSECMRNLCYGTKRKKLDTHLYRHAIKESNGFREYIDDGTYPGVCTHGCNNISDRDRYFDRPAPPFEPTEKTIKDIGLPLDIVNRLRDIKRSSRES